jgi:hypothetical protein
VISAATGIPVAALRDEQQARRSARLGGPATKVEAQPAPDAPLDIGAAKQG